MPVDPTGGSADYFQALVESAPDAFLVVDEGGLIQLVNRQAELLTGYARQELIGQPVDVLVPERAKAVHPSHRASFLAEPRTRPMGAGLDLTIRRKDAIEVPVDISLSSVLTVEGLVVSVAIRDITERQRAASALEEAYSKLSASLRELERHDREMTLLNEMTDMLESCLTTGEANEVIARHADLLFPQGSGTVFTSVPPAGVFEAGATWGDRDIVTSVVDRQECWALRRGRVHVVDAPGEGPVCAHVGTSPYLGYACVPMMAQGETLGLFHVRVTDRPPEGLAIQELRKLAVATAEHLSLALANLSLRESLRHQSISDPLTGLYNRRYLQDNLVREINRAGRSGRPVGIVIADVDHFKDVNDSMGHGAGDEVLRSVARALEAGVRAEDTVCRFGGDEFVLVLPDSPLAVARQRAEDLRGAVSRLVHDWDPTGRPITLSMGVAVFPDHGSTADAILRAADTAMYEAKARGRDRVAAVSS